MGIHCWGAYVDPVVSLSQFLMTTNHPFLEKELFWFFFELVTEVLELSTS